MAVGEVNLVFHPVPGAKMASVACGIKADETHDLVLFEFAEGSTTAAVFTQSVFAAAPVLVGRSHLQATSPRYFLINSGNANAATGEQGNADALTCCKALSQATGARPEDVIPFSTGVIGERLQVQNITDSLQDLVPLLSETNWLLAARGIMTTDTRPKIATRQFELSGEVITITGIAKGAGMIQPNMATMLCYIATDVRIESPRLKAMLDEAVEKSFNRITVDSDTSTNDSCMVTATGQSKVVIDNENYQAFYAHFESLMLELAQGLVRDAEGATKFVAVTVTNGETADDCLKIAYAIANSPLMKTALYASDANWGRIVMAIGKAGVALNVDKLDVFLGDVCLMYQGGKDSAYDEANGAAVMANEEISITVDLNAGDYTETVWTSDLSHEYVRINAEYRT